MDKFLEDEDLESSSFFINRKIISDKQKDKKDTDTQLIENSFTIKSLADRGVPEGEINSLLEKQDKIKKILKIIEENDSLVKKITSSLEKDLSNFNLEVDISDDPLAIKATKHIFKKPSKIINYEMYLYAKNRLNTLYKTKIEDGLNE